MVECYDKFLRASQVKALLTASGFRRTVSRAGRKELGTRYTASDEKSEKLQRFDL
jgi:hypothetical protein